MKLFQGHDDVTQKVEVSNAKSKIKDILVAGIITLIFFILKSI